MDEISVIPSSKDTAACGPIILRQSETVRLVFQPMLINSAKDKSQSVKGVLLYQRKKKADEWEDVKDVNLAHLKSGEGVYFDLNSEEVSKLVSGIQHWHEFYKLYHIPSSRTIVVLQDGFVLGGRPDTVELAALGKALVKLAPDDLVRVLELIARQKDATSFVVQIERLGLMPEVGEALRGISPDSLLPVLKWAAKHDNPKAIVAKLQDLDVSTLHEINTLLGLVTLKKALTHWSVNKNNASEEDWQTWLNTNSFVFSQLFSFPVVIHKGKAYVGGKGVENTGGNIVDYLCKNELTANAALVEIKTPVTPLLADKYRGDVYNLHQELTGAVQQVTNSKHAFQMEFPALAINSRQRLEGFNPPCYVIAGNTSEFGDNREQVQSFELFRNGLKDVVVITFDEMFRKVQTLVELLEKGR